jgi:radical SAM enzyme (TIGR01210 family)
MTGSGQDAEGGRPCAHGAAGGQDLHLRQATETAGKCYSFDNDHDNRRPIDHWFQESGEGLILFTVFYTRACRWSLCTGCNLPSLSSEHQVDYFDVIKQIDHIFQGPDVVAKRAEIRKVIISNNGSILDEDTFPSTALMYLIARINLDLPSLEAVSFESRPEYVDIEELEFLSRATQDRRVPARIELAIGFEAFDDHIRNRVFLKGLTLEGFEDLVEKITHSHFHLKCYFMQKPVVEMTDEDAVEDIRRGIDYLSELTKRHGVPINMHLNPTFVARGTPLEEGFRDGRYSPPRLRDVADAVLHSADKPISVFVGLNDEGLAVEGGSFVRDGEHDVIRELEAFNRSQDYRALARFRRKRWRG